MFSWSQTSYFLLQSLMLHQIYRNDVSTDTLPCLVDFHTNRDENSRQLTFFLMNGVAKWNRDTFSVRVWAVNPTALKRQVLSQDCFIGFWAGCYSFLVFFFLSELVFMNSSKLKSLHLVVWSVYWMKWRNGVNLYGKKSKEMLDDFKFCVFEVKNL